MNMLLVQIEITVQNASYRALRAGCMMVTVSEGIEILKSCTFSDKIVSIAQLSNCFFFNQTPSDDDNGRFQIKAVMNLKGNQLCMQLM